MMSCVFLTLILGWLHFATPGGFEVAQIHAAAPGSRKNLSDKLKTGKVESGRRWKMHFCRSLVDSS